MKAPSAPIGLFIAAAIAALRVSEVAAASTAASI